MVYYTFSVAGLSSFWGTLQQEFFKPDELRALFTQLASGMQAINAKLVHRDIKPDNILLDNGIPKISDFGLSKIVGAATRTKTFKGMNHIMYCAPEAWRLEKNLPVMDMYSMGIVFYEIATLQHPYQVKETGDFVEAWKNAHLLQVPTNPQRINGTLDLGLTQLIMKMISKRQEERYSSWDEVLLRLSSSKNQVGDSHDVSQLIERAIESQSKAEQARLLAEEKAKRQKERADLIAFSFNEILKVAQEIVDTFNDKSDFVKLQINRFHDFSFSISRKGVLQPCVGAAIELVIDEQKLDGLPIRAWGSVEAPSGRGFNILLIASDQDDLYGHWRTLHVKHSGFSTHPDRRPEPFPFKPHELPREIQVLKAIHIYHTDQGSFERKMLDRLIEELL